MKGFNVWNVVTDTILLVNRDRFRCHFCGHRFEVGESYLRLYTNDLAGCGGNPLVCQTHEEYSLESLRNQWIDIVKESERFWWLSDN